MKHEGEILCRVGAEGSGLGATENRRGQVRASQLRCFRDLEALSWDRILL